MIFISFPAALSLTLSIFGEQEQKSCISLFTGTYGCLRLITLKHKNTEKTDYVGFGLDHCLLFGDHLVLENAPMS